MKIIINTENKRFFLCFPNCIFLNSVAYRIAKKSPSGDTLPDIPPKALKKFRKTIKQMHRIHKNWYIVDVCDGDTSVKIKM